ncbi:M1 family aminopeptidase [Flavobacterium sp.]|uniref:M1 family aminopeptidase n=1 Tax=Flavobacterium sp. TaxID=239 RepID=UPI003753246F
MKKHYLLVILFFTTVMFSQKNAIKSNQIAESEMKSASKLINIQANPNTQNYDVTYHKLEFTVNPSVYGITGKVTTTFTALSSMSTVTFDLTKQLTVSSVKKNNVNLTFVQTVSNELVITLPSTLAIGATETLEINYSGAPATGEQAFTRSTHNGTPVIYTLSEPFGARDWWPCKQDLNDKVNSIDVFITAPSQYVSVSNGIETTTPVINGANKTTHFHHGYPIPAYLIAIAVTNYSVYNQVGGTAPNTYPIINYIYPESLASVQTDLDQTPLILALYESLFEIYPFHTEKYGHAEFGWGGGMEHTTVSFMVGFDRQLIAHEMAHQWFGDKITCGSWKDIWLNEGFATYVASLVYENFDGSGAFINEKANMINNITSQTGGAVYLTATEATNVDRIFSSRLSYDKGAMVINMLRFKLGDALFFQGMRNYLADTNLAYKYAVTSDLQYHLETVYGQSLTEFFNDWVYNQGYPIYSITANNWGLGQAKITINQTQSNSSVNFFEMPVPITLTSASGQTYNVVLNNVSNGEEFIIPVPFLVSGVAFDTEKNIISKNSTATLSNELFEQDKAIKIYPNPATDQLHIQMPLDMVVKKIKLFNNLGQMVLENSALDFTITSLSDGIYTVQIETLEGVFHKKIIKN